MGRLSAALFLALAASSGLAQQEADATDPTAVPPDAFVTVRLDANGADIVDIKMRKEGYPLDILRKHCEAFALETGSEVRGLYVFNSAINGNSANMASTAKFGCNHLVDRNRGELNIEAIVKSFLGAPDPWVVRSFLIVFADEKPTSETIKSMRQGNVRLEANDNLGGLGVEYRVLTLTQDPKQVHVPRNMPHKESKSSSTPPAAKNLHPAVIPLLAVGVVGAGVLVYFGLRKEKPRPRD